MPPTQILNIAVHVIAGAAAIALGLVILAQPKGTAVHRRRGRWFAALTLAVAATAALGSVFFRFIPLFAVLTILVPYQLIGGIRAVRNRNAGPQAADAALTLAAIAGSWLLLPSLLAAPARGSASTKTVMFSLVALALVLAYDLLRLAFPRAWHARVWRYEHIYKMIAPLFGMVSAASGNLLRAAQPWSQILPSVLALALIGWFFRRTYGGAGAAA